MGPATLLGQMYTYVGGQGTTGAQIDILRKYNSLQLPLPASRHPGLMILRLVGGPNRPIPQPKDNTLTSPGSDQSYVNRVNATKDSLASGANDIYSRLGSAVSERGEMLDGLEDTVNSLRTGSENMLAQVRHCGLPLSLVHFFMTRIGEKTCCRAVRAKLVWFLTFSGLRWTSLREWKNLRKGRLAFSCTFFEGMRKWTVHPLWLNELCGIKRVVDALE